MWKYENTTMGPHRLTPSCMDHASQVRYVTCLPRFLCAEVPTLSSSIIASQSEK